MNLTFGQTVFIMVLGVGSMCGKIYMDHFYEKPVEKAVEYSKPTKANDQQETRGSDDQSIVEPLKVIPCNIPDKLVNAKGVRQFAKDVAEIYCKEPNRFYDSEYRFGISGASIEFWISNGEKYVDEWEDFDFSIAEKRLVWTIYQDWLKKHPEKSFRSKQKSKANSLRIK